MNKYDLIYADPAWHWASRSQKGEGRSAKNHYTVTSLDDMKRIPVCEISNPESVLLQWVIDPMLPQGLELAKSWGFSFVTVGFYWIKLNKKWDIAFYKMVRSLMDRTANSHITESMFDHLLFTGLGYYTRANPEQCWLFVKDKPNGARGRGLTRIDKGVRRLIVSPIGRHSAKPHETYNRIERLFGDVSRVELFARNLREGWDSWGNQIESTINIYKDGTK